MTEHRATCSCGQLQLTARGEPVRVSICHCEACQRRTGSVYGVQARFPVSNVALGGEFREYLRTADSGNCITFRFCPDCGATLHLTLDSEPHLVGVPVGAFVDPDFPAPSASIYECSRHQWVTLPPDIEHWQ